MYKVYASCGAIRTVNPLIRAIKQKQYRGIARQMGHCMGGNFNIHIWAWSASPSVQVGR